MNRKFWFIFICLFFSLFNTFKLSAKENENLKNVIVETQNKEDSKQSVSSSDIAPLFEAAAKLLSQDRYQIESEMVFTGDAPGIQFTSNLRIKTITEAPNKLNSEITFFSPSGLSGKQYKIISDGDRVWIYDSSKNQYSISTHREFVDSNDGFFTGAISFIYLSLQSDSENAGIYTKFLSSLSEKELINFLESELDFDREQISIREETVENSQYLAYIIKESEEGFIFKFFLDPLSNEVKIISLSGKSSGLDIVVREKINSSISPLSLPRQTFNFLPPIGSTQAEQTIEVSPF